MPRALAALLFSATLAFAPGAGAAGPVRGAPHPEAVLLARADLAAGWDVVDEVPEDGDPDFVRWGVRDKRVRHYTHMEGHVAQVCSIEVWRFRDRERAQAAFRGFAYPDWSFARVGALLLAVHGHQWPLGGTLMRGVFDDCRELFARTQARAESLR